MADEFADDRQFAATLARGLEILHCFTPRDTQLGNAELASRTGMAKATISRFTYTLVRLGYLRINRLNNKYQLGSAVLSLGYPLLASLNIRQIARPFMKEMADHIRGSVSLGMRDRLSVVYLESSRSAAPRSHPPDVGLSYPIVRTAMGRALIAASSREERTALLNEIKVKTPDDWKMFQTRIEESVQEYNQRGFCVSYGDLRREIHAVAVPMRPMPDGEILVFNCGVSAFMLNEGQLKNDIGQGWYRWCAASRACWGFTDRGLRSLTRHGAAMDCAAGPATEGPGALITAGFMVSDYTIRAFCSRWRRLRPVTQRLSSEGYDKSGNCR